MINNNNIQRLKSKEFNKKKSKENFMTKNEIIEPELVPISHGDFNEYKINLNNINDKSLKRTSSLTYNENEFESDETINRKNSIYKHLHKYKVESLLLHEHFLLIHLLLRKIYEYW